MFIKRHLEERIIRLIGSNKVLLILGTRRVGKTFLINQIKDQFKGKILMLNAEDFDVQEVLKKRTIANYQRLTGDTDLLIIDEVQAIPEIGLILKLMIDSQPQLTIIATGSSSLDLVNTTGEPLTGRQHLFNLYPIAQLELAEDPIKTKSNLEERMILGSYPEIFQLKTTIEKESYLKELTRSYLLKDILAYADIKHANKLIDLLRLIAFQVGSEVSLNELSLKLGINKITVENYLIAERLKRNAYLEEDRQMYFWRNYNQQEIDLIEVYQGGISAFEIKYGISKKVKIPQAFKLSYVEAAFTIIDPENYGEFVGIE